MDETPGGVSEAGSPSPKNKSESANQVERPRFLHLVLGFFGAFALSWLFVVALVLSFKSNPTRQAASVGTLDGELFSHAVHITKAGPVLSVTHHQLLNPGAFDGGQSGDDFLLFVWFNLKSSVDVKERATFLGKYNSEEMNPEGYAVALVGGPEGVRPTVYWQNKTGRGRWYTFASTVVEPGRWYLLGVTFRAQRYLGVHIAPHDGKARVEVLGGYDLGGEIIPQSSADLEVGAFKKSKFRGAIGPFGVLRGVDILEETPKLLQSFARDPASAQDGMDQAKIVLWADPLVDRGPRSIKVTEFPLDRG